MKILGGYFNDENNDSPTIGKNRIKIDKYDEEYPRRSLLMIPYRFTIKMIDEKKWLCRNEIIWKKKVCQPTSAKNRFTIDFEPMFLFSKKQVYYFDKEKVKSVLSNDMFSERERRSVWELNSEKGTNVDHIAPYPLELVSIPIKACCPVNGIILDPFMRKSEQRRLRQIN